MTPSVPAPPSRHQQVGWRNAVLATLVAISAIPAHAQAPARCSEAYATVLSELNTAKGGQIAGAVAAMTAADPVLPGRWIYSQTLLGKPKRLALLPLDDTRTCLEPVKIAGRVRCRRFGDPAAPAQPDLPAELEITPPPNAAEMRVLKAIADLVESQGAVPDVGPNGRHRWLAERASSDLRLYVSQPAHPGLCAGAKEVVEFYATSLQPLQKRAADVAELVRTARKLSVERMAAIPAVASPAAPAAGAPGIAPPAPAAAPAAAGPTTPGEVTQPVPPPPPAAPNIDANEPLVALVADAVRSVLSPEDLAAVLNERTGLAALQRAKIPLIKAQVSAHATNDTPTTDRILAVGRAVRVLEAVAYAEVYRDRYAKFSDSVLSLPAAIQSGYAKSCTCGD